MKQFIKKSLSLTESFRENFGFKSIVKKKKLTHEFRDNRFSKGAHKLKLWIKILHK